MFRQILDGKDLIGSNIFATIQQVSGDTNNYQNVCWYIYENGAGDLSGGFLQTAFINAQTEVSLANEVYNQVGIKVNFKIIGYQFSNTQTNSGKMYCYFVIQDFASAQVTPILY
jgi:hypothetical protein